MQEEVLMLWFLIIHAQKVALSDDKDTPVNLHFVYRMLNYFREPKILCSQGGVTNIHDTIYIS